MDIKIISEEAISMFELKKELEEIEKKDKELNFRSNKTKDYLNNFISLNEKQYEDLRKKIKSLKIPRLKEDHIIKILDVLPRNLEELKSALQQFTITVNNDNLKKIMETIDSVIPKETKKEKKK